MLSTLACCKYKDGKMNDTAVSFNRIMVSQAIGESSNSSRRYMKLTGNARVLVCVHVCLCVCISFFINHGDGQVYHVMRVNICHSDADTRILWAV